MNDDSSSRDDYIGALFITNHNYWIDFGRDNLYINPPEADISKFMKRTKIPYKKLKIALNPPIVNMPKFMQYITGGHKRKIKHPIPKYYDGYLTINLSVNGHPPVKFLIDNGASVSLIGEHYAHSIGLKVSKQGCSMGDSQIGKIRVCPTYGVVSLKQGGVEGKYLSRGFLVTPIFMLPGSEIKGVIGMDWLAANQVLLSAKEKSLYIIN